MSQPSTDPDVVVVGAGPAGMAAAGAAAFAGCRVEVIDTYAGPGGQYHRQRAADTGHRGADRRFTAMLAAGRITLRPGITVFTATHDRSSDRPFVLHLTEAGGATDRAAPGGVTDAAAPPVVLLTRTLIVATGAIDRVLPFPGWDLPGVFSAGGAQALLKGHGVLPGRRVVVAGSGPFLLPVAAGLAAAGSTVVEVAEASALTGALRHAPAAAAGRDKLREGAAHLGVLARHRVPLRRRRAVVRAEGDDRVEQLVLADLDDDWRVRPGTARRVAVDAVCVSFGFVPQVGLPALLGGRLAPDPVWGEHAVVVDGDQHTSVPGLLAAGESTGVTGAQGATAEGTIAGLSAALRHGRLSTREHAELSRTARTRRDRERRLAEALAAAYPARRGWIGWLEDDTVVCRCEEVEFTTVRKAVTELAARDLRSVKLTTRCGMGLCQGRMCGPAVSDLVAELTGQPAADAGSLSTSPILEPVTLQQIAGLDLAERGAGGQVPDASEHRDQGA